jgi:UDP-N-acetylglucosamine--N-acetylmuramyl-(pentapeptide) pyrophosphoryl-undecaprenol N-acetylglucosamine transferase
MRDGYAEIAETTDVQFIWQIGKFYETVFKDCETARLTNVKALTFVDRMDLAYQCADLVICRSGALTISELCLLGKPSILVPSPNVSEDHQTKNARALQEVGAALIVADQKANEVLLYRALEIIHDEEKLNDLRQSILKMARPDATENIVNEIEVLAQS